MKKILLLLLTLTFVLSGCSTMTTSEKEQKRSELDAMAEKTIAGLIEQDGKVKTEIDESVGYAVANMKLTKVPIVGAGGGEGVSFNKNRKDPIYFTVSRFDLGGGWGARSFKVLLVFQDREVMENLNDGIWEFQAGVEASAGTASAEGSSSNLNAGFTMHVLSDGGASATVTARVIRLKVNKDLTENQ